MQPASRTALTHPRLILTLFLAMHFISACSDANDSTSADDQQTPIADVTMPAVAKLSGTAAVSPEALFDFLYAATQFEFWNCMSSDDAKNTYIVLDSKDDETDEGFNPLLLLGRSGEQQLEGDPRARNDNDAELKTISISFAVTSTDSISVRLYADHDLIPSTEDSVSYLTTVRTGPGRTFTAENQLNNTHIICTADNAGANMMF